MASAEDSEVENSDIVIATTVKVKISKQENRYQNDYLPVLFNY